VSQGSTGTGSSWTDASGDLNQILNIAPTGSQVWVKEGTYYPTNCSSCTEEQKDIPFEIPDSVEVYGGFSGNEVNLSQRDWESNETILSGDIDLDGTPASNAFTIVHFTRVSASTILDGFILKHGNALSIGSSMSERQNCGGALFNQGGLNGSSSEPRIRNCIFLENYALGGGGAVYNNSSFSGNANPVFENCSFLNNVAEQGGGAVYNQAIFSGTSYPEFFDCNFTNNSASQNSGGAMLNQASEDGICNTTFVDCYFDGNSTNDYGGAVHSHGRKGESNSSFENCTFLNNEANFGGGVSNNGTENGESNAVFNNCLFENNHVTGDGAGVYNWGSVGESNNSFVDCVFRNNNSDFAGAGIFNNGINGECNATIINCKFIENNASTYGGAVYNNGKKGDASATIVNSLFQKNTGSSAGGIYNLGSENGNSSPHITNCTFFGNTANVGGAVYNNANDSTGTSSPIITNCIFYKNKANFGNVFRNILSTPFIQYSSVDEQDCNDLNSGIGSNVSCGNGLFFNVDPVFEDTLTGDFRLKENSPLIDVGDNTTINATNIDIDLAHETRIQNGVVDFGAIEYISPYIAPTIIIHPQNNTLCEESPLTLSISTSGTPPLTYQWFKNGSPLNNAIDSTFSIAAVDLLDAGIYYCVVMSSLDTINSNSASITVEEMLMPSVEIEAEDQEICEGEILLLNLSSTNEGVTPMYSWYVNDSLVTGNLNFIELENLNDDDQIVVQMVSSMNCTLSNSVTDTFEINVVSIANSSLEINGPEGDVCSGETILLETLSTNGGVTPIYSWYVNNNLVTGNLSFIELENLNDGDQVSCQMVSSMNCVQPNSVADTFEINTTPVLSATLTVSGPDTIVCLGEEAKFIATPVNGGQNPSFTWMVNDVEISSQNTEIFISANLEQDDKVTCILTSSEECIEENPVYSNDVFAQMDSCTFTNTLNILGDESVRIIPNPSDGNFSIHTKGLLGNYSVKLVDLKGILVFEKEILLTEGDKISINIPNQTGVFIVMTYNEKNISVQKLMINQP